MKKRVLSLMLVLSMAASVFTGCGSTTGTNDATDAPTINDNASATTAGVSANGAATFKIGAIGPFTGGGAAYGNGVKNGAKIAIDEINAAGGINGYRIEYNSQDDELDNEKSVNAYNALKDWGMQMLIGSTTSGCSIAVSAESAADNLFQITPSASASDAVLEDNVFQVCFTDPNQGIGSAQYIGTNAVAKKVAVIYDSSDVYSSGIYEKFAAEAKNQSFEIVATEAFTTDNKTDFSVQIQKAKEAGAELVYLPIYYTEASLILSQAATMDYAPLFFGCDGLDGILTVDNFDTKLAEGVMLLTPFAADAKDERTQKFVSAYQTAYGEIPNQFAADAYDAVYILKAAAEAKNVTPDMSISDICNALKSAMTEIKVDGLTGDAMTWAATGEVNKAPKAMVIKNGEYALVQ